MARRPSPAPADALHWIDAGQGYALALDGDRIVARNAKGQRLSAVPKQLAESDALGQLHDLKAFLERHATECRQAAETWMLRSLPIPFPVLAAAWPDGAWRAALQYAVVAPILDGGPDLDAAGFLVDVSPERGLGLVDLDGESHWVAPGAVALPHPILLGELAAFRELATELGFQQGISQLFRETFTPKADLDAETDALDDFSDAKFEQLRFALGKCASLGFRVRGGYATCPVWEGGTLAEARLWVGADDPECEAYLGTLCWVDETERSLSVKNVGKVAFSEGMRMASLVHAAAKKAEEEEEDDD